jgi:hypothetical protein
MSRTYNIIDADGHVLEPPDFWKDYMDPAYRSCPPALCRYGWTRAVAAAGRSTKMEPLLCGRGVSSASPERCIPLT